MGSGRPALQVLNSDGMLHNVHALPKVNTPFNMAMPPTLKEADDEVRQGRGQCSWSSATCTRG